MHIYVCDKLYSQYYSITSHHNSEGSLKPLRLHSSYFAQRGINLAIRLRWEPVHRLAEGNLAEA